MWHATTSDSGDYRVVCAPTVDGAEVCSRVATPIRAIIVYPTPRRCNRADLNADGRNAPQDIFDFLDLYFTADPRADFNGIDGITIDDLFLFLAIYFQPCDQPRCSRGGGGGGGGGGPSNGPPVDPAAEYRDKLLERLRNVAATMDPCPGRTKLEGVINNEAATLDQTLQAIAEFALN